MFLGLIADMKQLSRNFIEVFSKRNYLTLALVVSFIVGGIFYIFTYSEMTIANFGMTFYLTQTISQILITALFAIFLPVSIYKYIKFSSFDKTQTSAGFFGTFFGILVAGCPACSITLSSYVGLAGFFSLFPYYGLELKVLSVPLLMWANYSTLNDLNTCKLKKK